MRPVRTIPPVPAAGGLATAALYAEAILPEVRLWLWLRRRLRRRRLDEAWDAEALVETQSNLNADVPPTMPGRAGYPTSWLPGQRDGTS